MCVLQVPWPPRSMAESSKRKRWEKWYSKTLRGADSPTDQPAGRGDAHGHVFPTRGPCRSRARHCFERPPKGSDFYALPLPWGALQRRAYVCPAWRMMSIAPAGSSSNSVHKKSGQAAHPQLYEELGAGKGGGGGYGARAIRLYFSVSLFLLLSLPHYLSISVFSQVFFFFFFFFFISFA